LFHNIVKHLFVTLSANIQQFVGVCGSVGIGTHYTTSRTRKLRCCKKTVSCSRE